MRTRTGINRNKLRIYYADRYQSNVILKQKKEQKKKYNKKMRR